LTGAIDRQIIASTRSRKSPLGSRGGRIVGEIAMAHEVLAGSVADLQAEGQLRTKVGSLPVVVFWHDDRASAIEDRCPHLGFPLHQGTVESGLLTCHWHHARFDLASGCTLDLWADDARAFDVELRGDDVIVTSRPEPDTVTHLQRRLRQGLEDDISLVVAKSVLGLLEAGVDPGDIVRTGVEFGTRYRDAGWGAGLTTLVAMANLVPQLDPADHALALVHGLVYVARDTRGRAPKFPVGPLTTDGVDGNRLTEWYRRFVETRSADAAERVLETALDAPGGLADAEQMMFAAVTDHVFIDEGHTIDFTNKAFEALALTGDHAAASVLPSLVAQTASAQRSEEFSEWRHPHDLAALAGDTIGRLPDAITRGRGHREIVDDAAVSAVGWQLLEDDPETVAAAVLDALRAGFDGEQLGRAIAFAAGLRLTRFHIQNDHADWNTVHHSFTSANALHHALQRAELQGRATPELLRGCVHGALRVYLDRFLNVPAARLPRAEKGDLDVLLQCFEVQGAVDDAGNEAYGFLRAGGARSELIAALGHGLVAEDAGFHWYQTVEAGARQAAQWPEGSEESALLLTGVARFLAAHTPTRRELPTVVRIATRLRRGDALYEDEAIA
jgi:nitrite reductase/ring-hydroxylating ferredoxin subunit